ncbi:MAG TPA: DUF6515 family protein [Candidatus Omnitrophota bacterium]|nr:DUF6515 family protein [Candidatus Omnitrophota bacterium]
MFGKKITGALIFLFLSQSIPAFAQHGGPVPFHKGAPHRDFIAHRLPPGYISLLVGGLTYLYCEGLFYRYTPAGYAVVTPPAGAVVPALPPGYTTVFVNRAPYYEYGYTYYAPAPGGYTVVTPPTVPAPQPIVTAQPVAAVPPASYTQAPSQPAPANTQTALPAGIDETKIDTFEIHLPNGDGTFTLVTLRKTNTGFLGPQGEFYPDHPTVDQLKERYINPGKAGESDSKNAQ